MPSILGVGTSVPRHRVKQEHARQFARQLFNKSDFNTEAMLSVFENTTVRERYVCMDLEWFAQDHGFGEKNAIYLEKGLELAQRATLAACGSADIAPREIDHVLFISTTGIATPSLDAHLFNRLHFKECILRTPIWGLGCGGGVAGIARAADWLKAYPDKTALVIALELCGLTFVRNDLSKSNFIGSALFGDGCGALVMAGDDHARTKSALARLAVEASGAVTWRNSLEVMGWDVADEGLRVIFSKSIPHIVEQSARPSIMSFLAQNGSRLEEIRHFLSHPGGAKVIQAYQQALDLGDDQVRSMKAVLAGFGNMSSATVLFVLDHFLRCCEARTGDRVLSTALGPGFSSEMILGRVL
ncbi:MAG: type III polyketide synthase [Desulfobacteraceae bacterium]|nr:MAG: type III polyketide synthase [Desulfobacteraceae bacterium]